MQRVCWEVGAIRKKLKPVKNMVHHSLVDLSTGHKNQSKVLNISLVDKRTGKINQSKVWYITI